MKILPIFIPHLGCPFDCIYCDQNKISRTDKIDLPEIDSLIKKFCKKNPENNKEIAFFGGTFTNLSINKQTELFNLTKPYLNRISGIRISTRPDAINSSKLQFCQKNHVKVIELGIQSFSDFVLQKSQRGYTSEIAINACRSIKKKGFKLGIQLMPGLPGFSNETLLKTINETISAKPDFVRIYPTLVIKGTQLESTFSAGKYTPLLLNESILITAEMIKEFEQNKIKVIKIGLHSDIQKEDIIAGPFHPSFGELVQVEIMFQKIIRKYKPNYILKVSPKDVSLFKGHSKLLIKRIEKYFSIKNLSIVVDPKLAKNKFALKKNSEKNK